jgi:serine/threonine-protein kinase
VPSRPDDDLTIAPVAVTSAPMPTGHRFAPGAIVAGRYRLIALLGRGGMGEVYRAEDLTLNQPVALKFLPEGVTVDPARLAQFHNELRIARQVSHKNVCRLYDLGEADGRRFLTMEYVDGEDLASLLRRIGRLPQDKSVEIARQLCAGLAAAHERGVLHRDLKPANVMIDGDGNVRITDFGLAIAEGDTAAETAGTPQYMAPEQLVVDGSAYDPTGSRARASVKTDIYALGLVLFEIFTGRRAFDAKTLAELVQLHESRALPTPSSVVRDLDPAIERVILRCLEPDPAKRPGSALAVAAALPGADPLAAALAAGETPSPEMLAAAGEIEAVPLGRGLASLGVFLLVLFAFAAVASRGSLIGNVPFDKSATVLADRAQQIIALLGYPTDAADVASGFLHAADYTNWIMAHDQGPRRWDVLRTGSPPALVFWYRTSPRAMFPVRHSAYIVTPSDPPLNDSDMRLVALDTLGRLVEFHAVPVQLDTDASPAAPPRWDVLFAAAGLPMGAFWPVTPQWTPRDYADIRAAWEGPLPDQPQHRVRVEAAAYRGRPVSFSLVGPWSRPSRMEPLKRSAVDTVVIGMAFGLLVVLCAAAILLAYRNVRLGRGDIKGATRVAAFVATIGAGSWALASHHVPDLFIELQSLVKMFQQQAATAILVWVLYVAIEPFARRFWPDGLLGWSRLLSGRIHDARVGRDVLIGLLFGAALLVAGGARVLAPGALGYPAVLPVLGSDWETLMGLSSIAADWADQIFGAIAVPLFVVMVFVLLRLLLRRAWLATVVGLVLLGIIETSNVATTVWLDLTVQAIITLLLAAVVLRFGLLATVVAFFIFGLCGNVPLTLHTSLWWATASNLTLALLTALALFGFHASRAGQPLFGNVLPRE